MSGSRGAKGNKLSKLDVHTNSNVHLTCMVKWMEYINTKKTGSICAQLSTQHKLEIEGNRKYIKTLVDISLFLSQQGLAFRGHDESSDSLNQGKNYHFNIFCRYTSNIN